MTKFQKYEWDLSIETENVGSMREVAIVQRFFKARFDHLDNIYRGWR